ncbi:hypothetical protein H5410_036909 [Solanum commersonii]|uniref:RNA-directed DNA polymerase, eukaryota, Reverse transcriptase zinc-binding domain protein n=1 Tax=Solanum commersonii TaxID=4109 RepID=A0A9J5Y687_SOLCO|nr:hypothetical protein H5410_036909 [Solanum commersonii]
MKSKSWNKKSIKVKKGGKGKIPKYLNIKKDTTKILEVNHISYNDRVVHNTTRIQEHNNSNREMQTNSQRSTNLVEDLSNSGMHVTLSATNNFKDINGKLIVNFRPLRIGKFQRLEQNHINDMDMNSIVEESHEAFGQDQEQGAFSTLKDPKNPLEKDIQDITEKNASSPITNNNSPLKSTTSVTYMIFGSQFVYAKSNSSRRMRLWRSFRIVYSMVNGPWAVFGDFNTILNADEKKGGVPHTLSKSLDFVSYMDDCGLMDLVVIINDAWASKFPLTRIHHLPKTGSDHNILLLQGAQDETIHIKYFKFMIFWTVQGSLGQ